MEMLHPALKGGDIIYISNCKQSSCPIREREG
jgi:hypothetical protein